MTPHIQRDEPVIIRQLRIQLLAPRKPALRKSMNKQNRTTTRVSRLNNMQLTTATACDPVTFH
jgi:hypothetical protein